MKNTLLILCIILNAVFVNAQLPYQNSKLPVEKRVADLLSRMSLEDKIGQMGTQFQFQMDTMNAATKKGLGGIGFERVFSEKSAKEQTIWLNGFQKQIIESTKLGIPAIIHAEALHGLAANDVTIFPQAMPVLAVNGCSPTFCARNGALKDL